VELYIVTLLYRVLKVILLQFKFVNSVILGSKTPADFNVLLGKQLLHYIPIRALNKVLIYGITLYLTVKLRLRK